MKKRRVEVVIETHQIWTISKPGLPARCWCPRCARTVRMTTMDEAARLTHRSARTIYGWIEAGWLHYRETPAGSLRVCLDSLFAGPVASPDTHPEVLALSLEPESGALRDVGQGTKTFK